MHIVRMVERATRFTFVFAIVVGLATSASAQTVLFDFGNDTSFRGLSVSNPDDNGNYWNSFQPGLYYEGLIDIANNATTINFGFDTPVATDSYNGPAGITDASSLETDVQFTEIDAEALGNLGGSLAGAFDFAAGDITNPAPVRFQIQALDPAKRYDLSFFGSHKYSDDATTVYSIYTDATYTTLVDSVTLDVQDLADASLHNEDEVALISGVAPQTDNILFVEFVGSTGNVGYLNALQLSAAVSSVEGDFDNNFVVDGNDFLVWQQGGSPGGAGDPDDLIAWQTNYGAGTSTSADQAAGVVVGVPEPTAAGLLILASWAVICRSRIRAKAI